ncbi:MAG: DUF3109 family protein [Bacteroidales bacterium]|jgi:hypothetical protein|nr:DUF3109 family protein [Bacteroidales bacterium]
MLIVGNSLVSEDISDVRFCCNLEQCKGKCCVEGDGGAPLLKEEIEIIKNNFTYIKPYIPEKSLKIIETNGFFYKDFEDEYCTNLVNDKECVFVFFDNGAAKCAIEYAFEQHLIPFQKPVSCHLYPIRVTDYGDFTAVNFHYWAEVCKDALNNNGIPLYQLLKVPLIRRFGKQWYDELLNVIQQTEQH